MGVVKPATARWARWVRKATQSSMSASRPQWGPLTIPLPIPRRRHGNRCPCGECCVRREFSTPGEVSFPARAAHAVGRIIGGLRSGEGAGLRYRYGNQTVEYRHLVLEAG